MAVFSESESFLEKFQNDMKTESKQDKKYLNTWKGMKNDINELLFMINVNFYLILSAKNTRMCIFLVPLHG